MLGGGGEFFFKISEQRKKMERKSSHPKKKKEVPVLKLSEKQGLHLALFSRYVQEVQNNYPS